VDNDGGAVELTPDRHFRYRAENDMLGQRQAVSVEYPDGDRPADVNAFWKTEGSNWLDVEGF